MTRAQKVVSFACAFAVLIHAIASFFPTERLWGVNQLAYVPLVPRWTIIALAFLLLIPAVNRTLYEVLARFFNLVAKNLKKANRCYTYVFFSLVSIVPFWMFRAKTHLLGDGYLRAKDIMGGVKFSFTEPLDFYLHALAYRFLKSDGFQIYALLSCLGGAFLVFLALWLSYLLGKEHKERILAFVILISMGSLQLFFGYVESYTWVYVGITAYFLFALRFLEGKCSLIFPSLALLFSVALHLSALYLLPSLVYLCVSRARGEEKQFNLKPILRATVILLLVGVGLFILSTQHSDKATPTTYLISLSGIPEDAYSLFSLSHLIDMINEQLLISPVAIVLLVLIAFMGWGRIDRRDRAVVFLSVATFCSFVFALVMDPKLGYARDWDLFSSTGLSYTILATYLTFGLFRRAKIKRLDYIVLALASTAILSTLPWIYVNAREEKAVERFESLLVLDLQRSAYGREILAYYYRDQGAIDKEAEEWKRALSVIENERYLVNLGGSYIELGRYQEAIAEFRRVIQLNPNSADAYYNIGIGLARTGNYQEAQKHYLLAIEKDPEFWDAYVNLGALFIRIGDHQEALEVLNSAIGMNPDYFPAYYNAAVAYSRMGRTKDGIELLRVYLRRNPEDHERVSDLLRKMNIDLD